MHQVFCKLSLNNGDVRCPICLQGFTVFWSRYSFEEQIQSVRLIEACLRDHHDPALGSGADHGGSDPYQIHPSTGFNVPDWSGAPAYSAAAILAGSGK